MPLCFITQIVNEGEEERCNVYFALPGSAS